MHVHALIQARVHALMCAGLAPDVSLNTLQSDILMELNDRHKPNELNERWLWHGTDSPHEIMKYGFDQRFAGRTGAVFGKGIYFAGAS